MKSGSITLNGVANDGAGVRIGNDTFVNVNNNITLNGESNTGIGVEIGNDAFVIADNTATINGQSNSNLGVLIEGNLFTGSLQITGNSENNPVGISALTDLDADNLLTLTSNQDIQVDSLVSDGNITVTTPKFFRATGTAELFLSESEVPDLVGSVISRNGQVTITHGGNGVTSFDVGNPEVNGTEGDIIATENEIQSQPVESFLDDEIRGDIAILTGDRTVLNEETEGPEPDPETDPDPDPDPDPEESLPDVDDCDADCTTTRTNPELTGKDDPNVLITVDPELLPEAEQAILLNEIKYTDEFRGHLSLDGEETFNPKLPQLQEQLVLAAEETGEPTAIVYVSFIPATETSTHDQVLPKQLEKQTIEGTEILELVVVTPEGVPILKTLPVTETQVQKTAEQFIKNVTNRGRVNRRTYLSSAQQLNEWLIAPLEAELYDRGITNIAFVMPSGLRSLPVSALHNGEQFLLSDLV